MSPPSTCSALPPGVGPKIDETGPLCAPPLPNKSIITGRLVTGVANGEGDTPFVHAAIMGPVGGVENETE
jgi:hypothetical protein